MKLWSVLNTYIAFVLWILYDINGIIFVAGRYFLSIDKLTVGVDLFP